LCSFSCSFLPLIINFIIPWTLCMSSSLNLSMASSQVSPEICIYTLIFSFSNLGSNVLTELEPDGR